MTPSRRIIPYLIFPLLAALLSVMVTQVCMRWANITTDENSYVFQSYAFRDGLLKRPCPPFPHHVNSVMLVAKERLGWFSRYPPGHPLWLLPGTWLDMPRLMIPVAAALSVAVMMALAGRLGVPRLCMPIMLCLSPYFVFMYGTLLSHTSGFLAAALMLWAYFTWRRTDRIGFAALAGLAWTWLFLIRTYTGVLVAVPFGIDALVVAGCRRERRVFMGTVAFALCAAVGIGIYLAYNAVLTGDPLLPPYLLYQPGEALGFGPRSTYGYSFREHTLVLGLRGMWDNLVLLDSWLYGLRGSLVVVLVLAIAGWARQTLLLLAAALAIWFGYVFFYFRGIETVGPVYYFEALPFLFLAASLGVKRLWFLLDDRPALRRAIALVCLVAMVGGAGMHGYVAGSAIRHRNRYSRRLLDTIQSAPENALVILENIPRRPYVAEMVFNRRGLQGDPLVVDSLGAANTVLQRYFSDRLAFIVRAGEEDVLAPMPAPALLALELKVWKMHRQTGRSHSRDHESTAVRVARETLDHAGYLGFGRPKWIGQGLYRVEFDLATSGVTAEQPVTIDVATDGGRTILGRLDISGAYTDERFAIDFVSSDYQLVEPRVHFGGTGEIELKHIRIREIAAKEERP